MDNNESIVDQLFIYLNDTKDEKLEVKPNEFENLDNTLDSKNSLEKIKTDIGSIASKEIKIICMNIFKSFLELNDEKFFACIERIRNWTFEICMKEFIMNYYLYIKNDNRLRQYITMHLDQIVSELEDLFEENLSKNIKLFNFENNKIDYEIQLLRNELKNKLNVMVGIKSMAFNEDAPLNSQEEEKLDSRKSNDLRKEIFNKLKRENQVLEELL